MSSLIEEVSTKKQQVVHYERLKRYHGTHAALTNFPERNVTTSETHKELLGTCNVNDYEDCESYFVPFPNAYPELLKQPTMQVSPNSNSVPTCATSVPHSRHPLLSLQPSHPGSLSCTPTLFINPP